MNSYSYNVFTLQQQSLLNRDNSVVISSLPTNSVSYPWQTSQQASSNWSIYPY